MAEPIFSDRGRVRVTVEHVEKPAVQPGLASGLVAPGLDRFIVDMRGMAVEARNLRANLYSALTINS